MDTKKRIKKLEAEVARLRTTVDDLAPSAKKPPRKSRRKASGTTEPKKAQAKKTPAKKARAKKAPAKKA